MKWRRLFKYRLRTLLVLMTIASVWLGVRAKRVHDQEAAIARIGKLGGSVTFEKEFGGSATRQFLAKIFGDKWFRQVYSIRFGDYSLESLDEDCFHGLRGVSRLDLSDTNVGDDALAAVAKLDALAHLYLMDTEVTDASMQHLRSLNRLRWLDLQATDVTEEGLADLEELESLKYLFLEGSRVEALPKWMDDSPNLRVEL